MPATRTPPFVAQLQRASAQRGRLDPVYRDLSDHWTRILQRLYPVWALIGPGLSDPGHIELHSRTIYLDADELLGPREQIAAGTLAPRAILACFGVALHETFHACHSKRWALEHEIALSESADPAERQLAADRQLLEEPRMEAHGVRSHPAGSVRGRFVRRALEAAVIDLLLPRFAEQLLTSALSGAPLSREMAGRACVYLLARVQYGIVARSRLAALETVWTQVLGADDLAALEALFARVVWIGDGELEALDGAAREYRAIIGPPDPNDDGNGIGDGDGRADSGAAGGNGSLPGEGGSGGGPATIGSLADALEHALRHTRADALAELDVDVELGRVLDGARDPAQRSPLAHGTGTGAPSGRMPDRGVDRPPFPDEVRAARRYATRLQQALTRGTRTIDKRTPGGRFDGRAYARGQAQRAAGQPVSTHPWLVTRELRAPLQQPHVGLVIDTSGSMGAYEYALGPIAWILTDGLRQIGGRCATALFGNGLELLSAGRAPLPCVPAIATGGGTAFAGDAIELVSEHLEMTDRRRPRFVYVLSDGGWSDTRAGVERIRALAELGVPTIHIAIGIAPLTLECDRISVIADPADALAVVARDTVAALAERR